MIRKAAVLLAVLPCLWATAWAQAPPPPQPDPRQLLADVELLVRLEQLKLTVPQRQQILPYLDDIQGRLARRQELRDQAYARNAFVLDRARRALATGGQVNEADEAVLSRALEQLQRRITAEEQTIERLTRQLEAALTPRQLAVIETQEQRELRRQRLEALRGNTTAAGFIVDQIKQAKELPLDEYQRRRQAIATDIATRVEGQESARYQAFQTRVLGLLDALYALPPAEFSRRKANLETEVATSLELRPESDVPGIEGKIAREDYVELLRSPRTAALLREMIKQQAGRER